MHGRGNAIVMLARPAPAPNNRKRNLEFGLNGTLSRIANFAFCIFISERQQMLFESDLYVGIRQAYWSICIFVRTLNLAGLNRMWGWGKLGSMKRFIAAGKRIWL